MTAGHIFKQADLKTQPSYSRVSMTHFEGMLSDKTKAFIASYTEDLANKQGPNVKITLDTRCLKDAMKADSLSINIADSSPMHAGREVLVTAAGFLEVDASDLNFNIFQVTVPLGNTGFGFNFKFIANGANGPRMYIN
jgi:hypothetical protein